MKIAGWLNTEIFKVIGWSIIHSMWQFLLLFAVLKVLLLIINRKRSTLRYYTALIIFGAAIGCSLLTFLHEYRLFFDNGTQTITTATYPAASGSVVRANFNTPVNITETAPGQVLLNFLNTASPYLTFGWIMGMLLYLIRIVNGSFYLRSLRNLSTELKQEIDKKMFELKGKMQIGKAIKLIFTHHINEPLTFGLFKPVILLPLSYINQVPAEQVEMILAHELAHIKRHDYAVNLIQTALEAIYFYNPFFRAISNIIRDEREFCCDDMAANYCGDDKAMAIALTNLKVLTSYPHLALAAGAVKSTFQQRIQRLINPASKPKLLKSSFFSLVTIMLTLVFLTKFVYGDKEASTLPSAADSIKQLLTDNQVNFKETLLTYTKADKDHEIFLVSTIYGTPLYAYLDGIPATKKQMRQIAKVMQQKRTVTAAQIAAAPKDSASIRSEMHWKIYAETDSLKKIIKQTKSAINSQPSGDLENKLKELNHEVDMLNKQEVDLSMQEYHAEVKNIPFDVKLHVLLTKIIQNKEYTSEERKELNDLARKRTDRD
jgi:beta-lactamase regulating signal transducer with metallopeptidase domain